MNAGVVLVAAGLGTRLGAGVPKALVSLGGVPLVVHAVRRLIAVNGVSHVVVVVPPSHEVEFAPLLAPFAASNVRVDAVAGGAERSDSVRCGLRAVDRSCDVILVHDAARCLAPVSLAHRVLTALSHGADAVVPAAAVTDTVKVVEECEPVGAATERVVSTPPRAHLRAVQTPQGFRRSVLVAAHESGSDATDDAALIEQCGGEVLLVHGDPLALKITTPVDIVVAEHLLADISEADPV